MESVHDIYAAGSTARPLAVGDWVLKDAEHWSVLFLLVEARRGVVVAADVRVGIPWKNGSPVTSSLAIRRHEAEAMLHSDEHATWHRLTPSEAVAWMGAHLIEKPSGRPVFDQHDIAPTLHVNFDEKR